MAPVSDGGWLAPQQGMAGKLLTAWNTGRRERGQKTQAQGMRWTFHVTPRGTSASPQTPLPTSVCAEPQRSTHLAKALPGSPLGTSLHSLTASSRKPGGHHPSWSYLSPGEGSCPAAPSSPPTGPRSPTEKVTTPCRDFQVARWCLLSQWLS